MAETDPKTVQDLTAVVRPPGLGQPPRGVRGEAGSGAQSRLPEERPRREGVEASGLAPLAGPGVTSRGPAWVTRVCLLLEGLLGLWCRLGLFPGSSHKPVPL